MASVVTLSDVQHWVGCRRAVLAAGTVVTEQARHWLREHGVEVAIEEADCPAPLQAGAADSDEPIGESVLEVQLLRWVPAVLARLGLSTDAAAVREAVRGLLYAGTEPVAPARPGDAGAELPVVRPRQRAVITVLGRDRVGIIGAISALLAARQVNILDINQTLFGDLFSMNMAVDIAAANVSFAELKEQLQKTGEAMQLEVLVQREEVFDYMHRV